MSNVLNRIYFHKTNENESQGPLNVLLHINYINLFQIILYLRKEKKKLWSIFSKMLFAKY